LKNIGSRWRNLADGLLRIETLEAQLLTEWGQRLDKAHKERQEAARQRALRRATLISALVVALLMLALSIVLLRLASPQPRSCCALPSCFLRYWPSVEFYSYSEALTTLPGTQ
jgi:hypothetical protein